MNQRVRNPKRESWIPTYLALGLIWGASFLFIERSLTFLTPVGVAFLRCALGALALWFVLIFKKMRIIRDSLLLLQLWVVGMLLNVLPGVLFAFAQERVSSILAGITQCIMLSLSMVVIAALVGADGLGKPVVRALNSVNIADGFEAGLAIVIVAIVLDRLCKSKPHA